MNSFTDSAGYGGSGAGIVLFKQFLTLLGGAGYGGSGASMALFKQFFTLLGGAGYKGSESGTLQSVFNFARCRGLRRVWNWLSLICS